jgi:hypothetical protein
MGYAAVIWMKGFRTGPEGVQGVLRVSCDRCAGITRKRACVHVKLDPWQSDVDVRRGGVDDVAQRTENAEVRHSSIS